MQGRCYGEAGVSRGVISACDRCDGISGTGVTDWQVYLEVYPVKVSGVFIFRDKCESEPGIFGTVNIGEVSDVM